MGNPAFTASSLHHHPTSKAQHVVAGFFWAYQVFYTGGRWGWGWSWGVGVGVGARVGFTASSLHHHPTSKAQHVVAGFFWAYQVFYTGGGWG